MSSELPIFRSQEDWEDKDKVDAISNAIITRQITTPEQLRSHIGNQSKKRRLDTNGRVYELPVGDLYSIKRDSRQLGNKYEHDIIQNHTKVLKTLDPVINGSYRSLPKPDDNGLSQIQRKALEDNKVNKFGDRLYDYSLGKALYDGIIFAYRKLYSDKSKELDEINSDIRRDLSTLSCIRIKENLMFEQLSALNSTQNTKSTKTAEEKKKETDIEKSHIHAAEKEKANQLQLDFFIATKEEDLIREANNYKKYLKYKAKYLALKKQLEQK